MLLLLNVNMRFLCLSYIYLQGYGVINEEIVNSFFMLIVDQLCYAGDAGKQV